MSDKIFSPGSERVREREPMNSRWSRLLGVADRAYVLSHGEPAMEGTAAELNERREVLEASYLGDRPLDK